MDTVDLPWLDPHERVGKAVDRLIQLNRVGAISAIVTDLHGAPLILDALALVRAAREQRDTEIVDVEPAGRAIKIAFQADAPDLRIEQVLAAGDAEYGVEAKPGPMVRVFTHDRLARVLRIRAAICECTGPDRHPWSPEDIDPSGLCWDGYPIVCE